MSSDAIRNFKDFLLQYNKISESCFSRCVNTFGQRDMTLQEVSCADMCVKKHTQFNFKVMSTYVEVQPQIVQKRIEEMSKNQITVEEVPEVPTESTNITLESDNREETEIS